MGFCFCLSSHIRTKHSISCLYKCRRCVETNQFLKRQGPGNFGDWAHPYFGGKKSPLSALFVIPPTCVQYGMQQQLIVLGNKQPNTLRPIPGARSANRGRPYLFQRGFHDLPMLRLFREFQSTS